jgi:AcrR family transcriptional regulator
VRASGKKKTELARGEPVVEAVLSATIEELASNGYRALSIEQVAHRAGVARTTVYRRWPTKSELVRAAIEAMPGAEQTAPEGLDLRSKLIVFGERTARFLATPHGRAVMRLFTIDEGEEELRATMEAIRRPRDAVLRSVLQAARAAGEVHPDTDIEMIGELLPAGLLARAVVLAEPIDQRFIERLVDFLLASAARGAMATNGAKDAQLNRSRRAPRTSARSRQ